MWQWEDTDLGLCQGSGAPCKAGPEMASPRPSQNSSMEQRLSWWRATSATAGYSSGSPPQQGSNFERSRGPEAQGCLDLKLCVLFLLMCFSFSFLLKWLNCEKRKRSWGSQGYSPSYLEEGGETISFFLFYILLSFGGKDKVTDGKTYVQKYKANYGKQYGSSSKKLKIELPYDPEILLLSL